MAMFDQTQGNNGFVPMGGYQYTGYQQPQTKVMNYLSDEEIKELQKQQSQFSLGLTDREVKQAACNHRTPDGMGDSLSFDQDTGLATCYICGYQFKPIDPDKSYEDIKNSTDTIVDILQTIKMLYTDLPAGAAREYFQIIPLINKIPQLFEFAAKNFAKHEYGKWNYNSGNMGAMSMLQNLSTLFGGQPQYYPQQPMMQQQAPMMNQPTGNMAPGYPAQAYTGSVPGMNPFGFAGASQNPQAVPFQPQQPNAYQPAVNNFQYQPNQTSTPVAPTVQAPATAPAAGATTPATEETTVKQNVTV